MLPVIVIIKFVNASRYRLAAIQSVSIGQWLLHWLLKQGFILNKLPVNARIRKLFSANKSEVTGSSLFTKQNWSTRSQDRDSQAGRQS